MTGLKICAATFLFTLAQVTFASENSGNTSEHQESDTATTAETALNGEDVVVVSKQDQGQEAVSTPSSDDSTTDAPPKKIEKSPAQQLEQFVAEYNAKQADLTRQHIEQLKALRLEAAAAQDRATSEMITQTVREFSEPSPHPNLEVISADWGIPRHQVAVPQRIKVRRNKAIIPLTTSKLGDPAYGDPKFLDLVFHFDGHRITLRLPEATQKHRSATATLLIEPIKDKLRP